MSAKRLSIRKIREVLRLKWTVVGTSNRRIAVSCGVSDHLDKLVQAHVPGSRGDRQSFFTQPINHERLSTS